MDQTLVEGPTDDLGEPGSIPSICSESFAQGGVPHATLLAQVAQRRVLIAGAQSFLGPHVGKTARPEQDHARGACLCPMHGVVRVYCGASS